MGSTLVVAGILLGTVLLFTLLFTYLDRKMKRKELARRQARWRDVTSRHELQITEKEEIPHADIGIDGVRNRLVYVNHYDPESNEEVIDLEEIKMVRVEVTQSDFVSKVQLELIPLKGEGIKYGLPFYQALQDVMGEQHRLKKRAEHWKDRVSHYMQRAKKNLSQ